MTAFASLPCSSGGRIGWSFDGSGMAGTPPLAGRIRRAPSHDICTHRLHAAGQKTCNRSCTTTVFASVRTLGGEAALQTGTFCTRKTGEKTCIEAHIKVALRAVQIRLPYANFRLAPWSRSPYL